MGRKSSELVQKRVQNSPERLDSLWFFHFCRRTSLNDSSQFWGKHAFTLGLGVLGLGICQMFKKILSCKFQLKLSKRPLKYGLIILLKFINIKEILNFTF